MPYPDVRDEDHPVSRGGLVARIRERIAGAAGQDNLPETRAGRDAHEKNRKALCETLMHSAQVHGRRRRATELDCTDFEAAYDGIVKPQPRPAWLDWARTYFRSSVLSG